MDKLREEAQLVFDCLVDQFDVVSDPAIREGLYDGVMVAIADSISNLIRAVMAGLIPVSLPTPEQRVRSLENARRAVEMKRQRKGITDKSVAIPIADAMIAKLREQLTPMTPEDALAEAESVLRKDNPDA